MAKKFSLIGELDIRIGDPYEAPHIVVYDGVDRIYLHDWLRSTCLEGHVVEITIESLSDMAKDMEE